MSTDLIALDQVRKILAQKIDADLEQVCIDDLKELFRQGVLTIQKTPTQYHIDYHNDKMQIQQAFSARLCWVGREKIEKLEAQNKRLREALDKVIDMLKRVSADYSQAEYARAVLAEIKGERGGAG